MDVFIILFMGDDAMELSRAVCTTCGANVEVDLSLNKGTCEACGNTYVIKHAVHLQKVEVDKTRELKNYRLLLEQAVKYHDYKSLKLQAKNILEIIPEDFMAKYYFAFASKKGHSPKALEAFYKGRIYEATPEAVHEVTEHIIKEGDLSDHGLIKTFLNYIAPEKSGRYLEAFNHKKALEDHYSIIPRDAFLCHRSINKKETDHVLKTLENDGYQCWVSYRNLRPNDNDNYWRNIEAAIEHAKIFIVISSNEAMMSKDVQRELDISEKLKKPRLELKIDDEVHTSLFKHFFDGIKWIDASNDLNQASIELKTRFYDLMEKVKHESLKDTAANTPTSNLENMLKRAELSLSYEDYNQAIKSADHALNMNVEASDAWYFKFLAEHKFKDTKTLLEFLESSQDFESIFSVIESKSLAMAKKFSTHKKAIDELFNAAIDNVNDYVKNATISNDSIEQLSIILDHNPHHTNAAIKKFLFNHNIASLAELEKRMKDIDYLIAMDQLFESDDYQTLVASMHDEKILKLKNTFLTHRQKLSQSVIKSTYKKEALKEKYLTQIKAQMNNHQFKKAISYTKKLSKLNKSLKGTALYYQLLCDYRIRNDSALNTFLSVEKNHDKIKNMQKHKKFKQLKNMGGYERFIQSVIRSYDHMTKQLALKGLNRKVIRIKEKYRRFISFSHFIIGLNIMLIGLIFISAYLDNGFSTYTLPILENTIIFESLFFISLIMMTLSIIFRELSLFRIKRINKARGKSEETKNPAFLVFLLTVTALVFLVLTYIDFIISPSYAYRRLLPDVTLSTSTLIILIGVIVTSLLIYGGIQKRSELLNQHIKIKQSVKKIIIRPAVFIGIITLIGHLMT